MTNEHEKYLAEGITRITTHCDQWKDDGSWKDHSEKVAEDLRQGKVEKYQVMLKAAYTADKIQYHRCYINDAYIICILKLLKLYKEDFQKGKNHKNNKTSNLIGGAAHGNKKENVTGTESEQYVL